MKKGISSIQKLYSLFHKKKSLTIVFFLVILTTGIGSLYWKYSSRGKYYRFRQFAISHVKAGDWYLAHSLLSKVIEINPSDDIAYYYRGYAKLSNKQNYDAIYDFTKAVEINPKNFLAYENMAKAKYNVKDYAGSIADYTKALKIKPKVTSIYGPMGLAKFRIGDFQGAIEDYTNSIKLNPNNKYLENVYFNRGTAKDEIKDYVGAISDYSKALEINPIKYEALFFRGMSKIQFKDKGGGCIDVHNTTLIEGKLSSEYKKLKNYASNVFNEKCGEFSDVIDLIK